ncbi:hypothetical protein B0H12DRAFT_1070881 [Mycena haematopus]|nr:hypothetical protein B0H12DRAFT_1070881 [Mycena haematopus]
MSPSMPINIATGVPVSSSKLESVASSSSSSPSSSSSSAGVYVPVHKRVPSASASSSAYTASESSPHRTLPIYTPSELLQLAHSPLVKSEVAATHAALRMHGQEEFAEIALNRRQRRAREYAGVGVTVQRVANVNANASAATAKTNANVAVTPAQRRRPVGRAAERTALNPRRSGHGPTNKFMDAASWRPHVPVSLNLVV